MKNCEAMVAYRTFNQWCRRRFVRKFPSLFRGLRDERIMLAASKLPTSYTRERIRKINWMIGFGSVYSLTPKERAEQSRIADGILREMGV